MSDSYALAVEGVTARYGQALALDSVTLHVGTGEIVGVLGQNGAGKTTLLRCLSRLHTQFRGRILVHGVDVSTLDAYRVSRIGLFHVRQGAPLPASLTVRENIELGQRAARLQGRKGPTLDEVWDFFPMLKNLQDNRAGYLSGGQRQALALTIAFAVKPELLLLDEPSAGLAPKVTRELYGSIKALTSSGTSALIVEQEPLWLVDVASRGYILELGKVTSEGAMRALIEGLRSAPRS